MDASGAATRDTGRKPARRGPFVETAEDRGRRHWSTDDTTRSSTPPNAHARWWEARFDWTGWASWQLTAPMVVAGGVLVLVEMASTWLLTMPRLGRIPVSLLGGLGVVLGIRLGGSALGLSRRARHVWREFYLGGALALGGLGALYVSSAGPLGEVVGVLAQATTEELVYRLALPIAVGALVAVAAGDNWRESADWGRAARLGAVGISGALFACLPGHVAQVTTPWMVAPFVLMGALLTYLTLRTGSLLPAVIIHATLNLATLCTVFGHLAAGARAIIVVVALTGYTLACDVAGRRVGLVTRRSIREHEEPTLVAA